MPILTQKLRHGLGNFIKQEGFKSPVLNHKASLPSRGNSRLGQTRQAVPSSGQGAK